jgi:hypothetical protein
MGADIPSPIAILLTLYLDGKITDCDLRSQNVNGNADKNLLFKVGR